MERSEPTLIPEWLKTTTTTTNHHFPPSSLHSDEPALALPTRNRSSLNNVDMHDSSHSSALLDPTSSSYFRTSNASFAHLKDNYSHSCSYTILPTSYPDGGDTLHFRHKDASFLHRDYADAHLFTSTTDKDIFRPSQSMISGKRPELRPRRLVAQLNCSSTNHSGTSGGNKIINIHNTTFERDFPSLGAEEKQGVDRVTSPGLTITAQSLPMATSAMIMANGWTSALAAPPLITGSNIMCPSSVPQAAAPSLVSLPPSTTTSLNMAETLAQTPLKARAAPQLSVETQRLEELAIKQSRQLIPMTPSMPKTSVLNSDKQKPKASARNEMSMANKIVQQQQQQQQLLSSQPANHPLRGGTTRSDATKTLNGGKLLVLKATWENGLPPATNESLSPTNGGRITSNPLVVVAPSVGLAPTKSQNNPKLAVGERKTNAPPASKTSSVEKKHTSSQAQSRSDFFNAMRKKTVTNNSSATSDTSIVTSPGIMEKASETTREIVNAASSQGSNVSASENYSLNADDGTVVASNGEKHSSSEASLYPYEKEVTLLRSMGWEEDAGDDAGEEEGPFLTQEEIDDFLEKVQYMKTNPSSKLCQVMGRVNGLGGDSEPSSSESKSKA